MTDAFDPTVLDRPRRDDGGPASLMTLRDYFAAHAPEIPASWFTPMRPPRPAPEWPDGADRLDSEPINWADLYAWDRDSKRLTYVQWPYAWADAMIAQRKVGG
jgi:hypothetical protein